MTSPLATLGVVYGGFDCQTSDHQIFLEIVRGFHETPSVRGVDVTVPALAGRIERNRKNDVLQVELRGFVTADPADLTLTAARSSFQANMAMVRALFAPDRARADLVITLPDGTQRSISARPLNMIVPMQVASEFARVSIELEGYDDWVPGIVPAPAAAVLTLTRFAPAVYTGVITPTTASLTATRFAPTVTSSG